MNVKKGSRYVACRMASMLPGLWHIPATRLPNRSSSRFEHADRRWATAFQILKLRFPGAPRRSPPPCRSAPSETPHLCRRSARGYDQHDPLGFENHSRGFPWLFQRGDWLFSRNFAACVGTRLCTGRHARYVNGILPVFSSVPVRLEPRRFRGQIHSPRSNPEVGTLSVASEGSDS